MRVHVRTIAELKRQCEHILELHGDMPVENMHGEPLHIEVLEPKAKVERARPRRAESAGSSGRSSRFAELDRQIAETSDDAD